MRKREKEREKEREGDKEGEGEKERKIHGSGSIRETLIETVL